MDNENKINSLVEGQENVETIQEETPQEQPQQLSEQVSSIAPQPEAPQVNEQVTSLV